MEIATLAGGCFWCTEAVFKRLKGVLEVTPGYTGGNVPNPTYNQVCSGKTGHAEAIEIKFDSKQISFEKILDVFFATHDPTKLNRQDHDVGTEYRSVIFYHDQNQELIADKKIDELNESGKYSEPIVTKLQPANEFYPAEDYHKNFYDRNKESPYCQIIIDPKIQKLLRDFKADLKE